MNTLSKSATNITYAFLKKEESYKFLKFIIENKTGAKKVRNVEIEFKTSSDNNYDNKRELVNIILKQGSKSLYSNIYKDKLQELFESSKKKIRNKISRFEMKI